jgi:hypothetical protein
MKTLQRSVVLLLALFISIPANAYNPYEDMKPDYYGDVDMGEREYTSRTDYQPTNTRPTKSIWPGVRVESSVSFGFGPKKRYQKTYRKRPTGVARTINCKTGRGCTDNTRIKYERVQNPKYFPNGLVTK